MRVAPLVGRWLPKSDPGARQPLSDAVAWQLLDRTYADPVALWAFLVLVAVLGGLAVGWQRDLWSVSWSGFGLCLAVARLLDWQAYPARRAAGLLAFAQRRFGTIQLCHGVYWAAGNLVLLVSLSPFLQFWIVNAETAVLSLTVARQNPMSEAVGRLVVISMISLVVCCLLSGNVYFQCYTFLVVLYTVAMLGANRRLNSQTVRLLITEERNAAMLRDQAETNARLDAANRQLEAMATTDGLTGIPNRRCFDDLIRTAWRRAAQTGSGIAMLMIDIDNFKAYNDVNGHLAGDACLRRVAKRLASALRRPYDRVARFGGEEFAVILTDADGRDMGEVAERLRSAIEDMALPSPAGGPVTVSIGAALCHATVDSARADDEAVAQGILALIADADAGLYEAKRAGRNCVRPRAPSRALPVQAYCPDQEWARHPPQA